MKNFYINFLGLSFVFTLLSATICAQTTQNGILNFNHTAGSQNSMDVVYFRILDDSTSSFVDNSCNSNFLYTTHFTWDGWVDNPSTNVKSNWASLPGGNGMQSFTAEIQYKIQANINVSRDQPVAWDVYVDGQLCTECSVAVTLGPFYLCGGSWEQTLEVTHPYGDSWDTDGVRTFGLRPAMTGAAFNCNTDWWGDYLGWTGDYFGTTAQAPEVRFTAVMVATSTTDSLGVLTTPLMPVTIIRDPPGDKSYGFIGQSNSQCFGTTLRTGTTLDQTSWKEVRLGVAGEVNLGLAGAVNFEIYGQQGTSAGYSYAGTYNQDLQTCFTSTSETKTPQTGLPNDVYLFSSTNYVYGYQKTVHREQCEVVAREGLIFVPTGSSSLIYTESALLTQHLPAAEQLVASLTPGTPEYENAVQQVSVFNQTIAMNAAIKAEAVYVDSISFSPGTTFHTNRTIASTMSREITSSVHLSSGLSEEYSSGMGGSSVTEGGSINIGTTYGQGQNSTLTSESSVGYHLEDDDTENEDVIIVRFLKDQIFGTNVFELGASSRTSCPYEGGYQIEKPQLWVGGENNTSMIINPPIGSAAIFPLIIKNNSNQEVTYELSIKPSSNPYGAVISGFNGIGTNSAVSTGPISAGEDFQVFISLNQDVNGAFVDFDDIEVRLRSSCGDNISSSVFLTSHFGAVDCSVSDNENPVLSCHGDLVLTTDLGEIFATTTIAPPPVSDNCSVLGNALSLDGVNDAITLTTNGLPLGNSSRTLEARIKTTQEFAAIVTFGGAGFGVNERFALYVQGGFLHFVAQANDYSTGVIINDGAWHHIAATHDGVNLKLYVDGDLVLTQATTFNSTSLEFSIGYRGQSTPWEYYQGEIEEVRLWNIARTQNQIRFNMSSELSLPQTGLVSYYKFNQGEPGGGNSAETTLIDELSNNYGGLSNFALAGPTSNWIDNSGMILTNNAPETFPIGNTTVTWTATDPLGNSASCSFDVIVNEPVSGCQPPSNLDVVEIGFGTSNPRVNATWTNTEGITSCEVRGGRISNASYNAGEPEFASLANTQIITATNGSTVNFNIALYNNPNIPFIVGSRYGYEVRCSCADGSGFSEWANITPEATFVVPAPPPGVETASEDKFISAGIDKMSVFPNPAEELVYIELVLMEEGSVEMLLMNALGQTVMQMRSNGKTSMNKMDISDLSAGIYMLTVRTASGMVSERLIVN